GIQVRTQRIAKLGVTLPGFVNRGKIIASLPSLALLIVAALTPEDIEVEYVEVPDINQHDINVDFDLVAISTYSAQIFEAYELADRYRAKGIKVVMGGLHVSLLPDEAKSHVDAVVVGEAEPIWGRLIKDFKEGKLKPFYRAVKPYDLGQSPLPRYDFLDKSKHNRITVQTARGCPHDCEFCAASKILGPYRKKPVELVVRDIKAIKKLWRNPFIEFADDNTFVDKEWSKNLLSALIPLKIKWFTETDISVAQDEELLRLLRPSGCHQLLVGLESVVRENLMGIERSDWKSKQYDSYLSAIERIQSYGVSVNGCFILGLDSDDGTIFEKTRDFIEKSQLLEAQITVLTPFPGTRLYERLKRERRLRKEKFWDRCTLFDINFVPKNMTVKQLEDGLAWLGSQIYSEEAYNRRKRHYKQIMRNLV
ncbi:MAG: radical SAM protein, partial [Dehalococcoidales bacterium]|nr:radical SAM protein [Dehalococcoidales bacterium]